MVERLLSKGYVCVESGLVSAQIQSLLHFHVSVLSVMISYLYLEIL